MATSSSITPLRRRSRRPARAVAPVPPPPDLNDPIAPMLATASAGLPSDPANFAFEYKWDGVRAICHWNGSQLLLRSRNRLDITSRYPELQPLGVALGRSPAILDGEIVALDESLGGIPSFALLQRRMHVGDPRAVARLMRQVPVWLVVFDVLYAGGRWLMDRPYEARRSLLERLVPPGANWQVTPSHVGRGAEMLEAARGHGLEGIVAKRLDSVYVPGARSPAWRKIKLTMRQEFVVGGWIAEGGGAATPGSRIGAMLLGYYDERGKLRYAGRVGSGLAGPDHQELARLFRPLGRKTNPFADAVPVTAPIAFVEPEIVVEVEYRRWPAGAMVQHASYQGVRRDKPAGEVVDERALPPSSGTPGEGRGGGRLASDREREMKSEE